MKPPYLLSAISYLLIIGSAFAWDDENWGTCQNKINERLYELKRVREQRLADFVGSTFRSGSVLLGPDE